jgi:hypothetical protein
MIVHLRRITPLQFPNLPRTSSTLLTVITEGAGQKRQMYHFRVLLGSGSPQYSSLVVYPDTSGSPQIELNHRRQAHVEDVEQGLQIAASKNLLGSNQGNQNLRPRVLNFLALARNGVAVPAAAEQSGVSMALITQLAEWGMASRNAPARPMTAPTIPTLP